MDKVIDFLAKVVIWIYGLSVNSSQQKSSAQKNDADSRFWDIVSCGVDEEKACNMASQGLDTSAIDSTDIY